MKKRFLVIAALIGLLAACPDPSDGKHNAGSNQKTFIVFDNTQGISAVVVYDDYRRRDEDKIVEIPAGASSHEIEWVPGTSVPFYFSYRINLKGISGFTLNYTPEIGKDQTAVRVDANMKTNIRIPKLDETVSSPDLLLSNSSYILIQNNSSFSFQLHRGSSLINPDGSSSPLVISGERAQYTLTPGAASNYRLLVGADYVNFPGSLISFEAGRVYSFIFDGGVSFVSEVEIKLENVAGVSPNKPVPEVPGVPVITAFDSLLTVHWTAVEGAEKYEVYISTTQNPPELPKKTVWSTTAVLPDLYNTTVYYVWVKAVNENGPSDFSPRARGIPWSATEVPAIPERPVIIPGINQLTVNWEENGGASSYEVYINTTPFTPSEPVVTSDKTIAVISYLENGNMLENGIIYYIWIRAVNNTGKSDYSPVEAGTPRIPTVEPAVPSHPILTAGNRELAVSWQAVELAAAYEVWFGTNDNSTQAEKFGGDISGGITETIITGLVNETSYYVWIKAKNLAGTSGFSSSANARPSAFVVLPETPEMPTVIPGSGELSVNWQTMDGALFYELWIGVKDSPVDAEKYGADISGTSTTIIDLTNGTTYYIWLRAKNNIGTGDFSTIASGIPSLFDATPLDPSSAPSVSTGNAQLVVNWLAVEGAISYEILAGTSSDQTFATKRGNDVFSPSGTITGLTNGTTYYVWIKAKNNVGTSDFSPMASGKPIANMGAITLISGNGQLTTNWFTVAGADEYEVYHSTNTTIPASPAQTVTATTATISSLTNGTTYYVWVKGKNTNGVSGTSTAVSGKPIANMGAVTLTNGGSGELVLSWSAVTGADEYEVYRSTSNSIPANPTQTVSTSTVTMSGLTNGTTYYVWIKAKNSKGTSDFSPMASGTPMATPSNLTVSAANQQITISWAAVSSATSYEVYYSTTTTIPSFPAYTVTALNRTFTGLTNGTTYYFWIKAVHANGTSGASPMANGKPLGTPGTPTITPDHKQLRVTWTAVAGADTYEVYYGTGTPTTLAVTTSGTTVVITGLNNGTTYNVRLRAKNANGVSDYGPSISGVPNVNPGLYRRDEKIGDHNLSAALSYIKTNAVTGDEFYIVLGANESISPTTLGYSGKTVGIILVGHGGERTISLNANGSMFTVNAGVTLTLDENVTLVGRSSNTGSLVYVASGSTLIMNAGAKISGNTVIVNQYNSPTYGGGIYVSSGTVIMNGGEISGNIASGTQYSYEVGYGGGIYVSSGTVTMNGGVISGNRVYGYDGGRGGGIYVSSGTVTINGGEISGNDAANYYGRGSGGGIYGTVTIHGGTISGNSANVGGGIYGTVTMHGGTISGNTTHGPADSFTRPSLGGGIYGTLKKLPSNGGQNSGIIYGSEETGVDANGIPLRNSGDAVYTSSTARRNTTAGQTDQIDTTTGRGLSLSGEPPYGN